MRNRRSSIDHCATSRLLLSLLGGAFCTGAAWSPDGHDGNSRERVVVAPRSTETEGASPETLSELPLRLSLSLVMAKTGTMKPVPRRRELAAVPAEPALRLDLSIAVRSSPGLVGVEARKSAGSDRVRAGPDGSALRASVQPEDETAGDVPGLPEQPVPFDRNPVPPPRRTAETTSESRPQQAVSTNLPDLDASEWGMAPIFWSGNTVSSINAVDSGQNSNSFLNNTSGANFQANSFIVAPYIARWNGNVNYNMGDSKYSLATGQDIKNSTLGLGFGLSADILSQSRFPLSLSYNQGFVETSSDGVSGNLDQKTRNNHFAYRQEYRPEEGNERYNATFMRSSLTSRTLTSDTTSMAGTYSTRMEYDVDHFLEGTHSIGATIGYTEYNAEDYFTERGRLLSGSASHSWRVHEDLDFRSSLQLSQDERFSRQQVTSVDNIANLFLATTAFTWRPYEDMPLTLIGGGSLIHTQVDNLGDSANNLFLQGYVTGTYRFNNNLSGSGGVLASVSTVDGERNFLTVQSAAVNYSGDPLQFMGYNYGWGVGAGASLNTATLGKNYIGTNLSASHGLGRTFIFGANQSVNLNASQTIAHSTNDLGPTTSFSNSIGATWSSSLSQALSGNLSANFADSISDGPEEISRSHFQSANILGGGVYQFSGNASATFNAGLAWSRDITDVEGFRTSAGGIIIENSAPTMQGNLTLGYTHRNLFSVPRLNYNANFTYSDSYTDQRPSGAFGTLDQSFRTISMQHLLDYRVGKLAFNLRFTMLDFDGRRATGIFASMSRDFDGIFQGRW